MPRTSTGTPPFDRRPRQNTFSFQLRPSRWSMITGCPASPAPWSMYPAVCSTPSSKAFGGGCFASARFDLRYRHRWQVGGLVIRDDRVVQHVALLDYEWPWRRLMHRVTAGGIRAILSSLAPGPAFWATTTRAGSGPASFGNPVPKTH